MDCGEQQLAPVNAADDVRIVPCRQKRHRQFKLNRRFIRTRDKWGIYQVGMWKYQKNGNLFPWRAVRTDRDAAAQPQVGIQEGARAA